MDSNVVESRKLRRDTIICADRSLDEEVEHDMCVVWTACIAGTDLHVCMSVKAAMVWIRLYAYSESYFRGMQRRCCAAMNMRS